MRKIVNVVYFVALVAATSAGAAVKTLQNDNIVPPVSITGSSLALAPGEMVAATFRADPGDYPFKVKRVIAIFPDNPLVSGSECGLFSVLVWADNGATDPVGAALIDTGALPGDNEITFELVSAPGAQAIDLEAAEIVVPVNVQSGAIRVGLRLAGGADCVLHTGNGQDPIMGVDSAIAAGKNFVYGGLPGSPKKWWKAEDTGVTGDFLIRVEISTPGGAVTPPDAGTPTADAGAPQPAIDGGTPPVTTVEAPTIAEIIPASGPPDADNRVSIFGMRFKPGATVRIGTTVITGVSQEGATVIRGTVPSGRALGTYDVVVQNSDGQTATLSGGYTVAAGARGTAPVVKQVTPNRRTGREATEVVILGLNFRSGATVALGLEALVGVRVQGSTVITATIPAGLASGRYDLTVTNSNGESGTIFGGFEVDSQGGISPGSGGCVVTPVTEIAGLGLMALLLVGFVWLRERRRS